MLPRAVRLLSLLPLLAVLYASSAGAAARQQPEPQHAGPSATSRQQLAPLHPALSAASDFLASPPPPAATPLRAGLHPGILAPPAALVRLPLFRYEHGGRRIAASGPSGSRSWLWSGDDVVEEEQAGTARVYERAGGLVLGFAAVDTSSYAVLGHESFVTDGLGSVVARVPDVPGAIAWHRYDAWGVFRLGAANDGTAPGAAGATLYGAEGRACLTCPQRFTAPGAGMSTPAFAGQYWDAEAGLSYAEQRWYAPELGSFLSVDPMLGNPGEPASMHVWGYANGSPTRFVDPQGTAGDSPGANERMAAAGQKIVGECVNKGSGPNCAVLGVALVGAAGLGAGTVVAASPGLAAGSLLGVAAHGETALDVAGVAVTAKACADGDAQACWDTGRDVLDLVSHMPLPFAEKDSADALARKIANQKKGSAGVATPTSEPVRPESPPGTDGSKGGSFSTPNDTGTPSTPPRTSTTPRDAGDDADGSASWISRGKTSHVNGGIAEYHGWQESLDSGQIGIRGPGKVTAPGADFITFDPAAGEVVVWDAKYRGPGGTYPAAIPASKVSAWTEEAHDAVMELPESPLRSRALDALTNGRVRGEIFKWPK